MEHERNYNDDDDYEHKTATQRVYESSRPAISTILLGVIPVFALGYTIHTNLLDKLGDTKSSLAAATTQLHAHIAEAERYKDKIDDVIREVAILQRVPEARPDPWTGTDGRKDRERIVRMEEELDRLKSEIDKKDQGG